MPKRAQYNLQSYTFFLRYTRYVCRKYISFTIYEFTMYDLSGYLINMYDFIFARFTKKQYHCTRKVAFARQATFQIYLLTAFIDALF